MSRFGVFRIGVVGWVLGGLVVGLLGGWALRTMLSPPTDVLEAPGYTLVAAREGSVGQTLRLNTSVEWSAEGVAANQANGTVTSVELDSGEQAKPGQVLYTVDLRPVVAGAGAVPTFRDLSWGVRGDDVAQLQRLLGAVGHPVGDETGSFGAVEHWAVRAWQRELGIEPDGVVKRGDVVFVPSLPARLALVPDLVVGAGLSGGEPAVQALPAVPDFRIVLPENQARMVAPGMSVEIPRDGADSWWAEVVEVRTVPDAGGYVATLGGVDGGRICGDDCGSIPLGDPILLSSVIHVVPEVSGVTVPAAALMTTASGAVGVVLASGEFHPVTVVASTAGTAVVDGVELGVQVRTPGQLPAASDAPDPAP